ncbi:MAG: histidine kinase, partial [Candidatus Omnitrophica bacterium]|nr:histidine kinase [Candidatus Omnitrophota bacterium]
MKRDKKAEIKADFSIPRAVTCQDNELFPFIENFPKLFLLLLRERKRLANECARLSREVSAFSEMTQLAVGTLEQDDILQKIHEVIERILNGSASAVFLYEEAGERFVPISARGLSEDFSGRVSLTLSDPLIEEMMALARPLKVERLEERSPIHLFQAASRERMKGFLGLPIMIQNKFRGLIAIFTPEKARFTSSEISLFSTLANQAGVFLESAVLYKSALKQQRLVEQLLGKVIQGHEESRKSLAIELHDSIAQSLVGIGTRLNVCRMMLKTNPEEAESELARLQEVLGEMILEVRNIMFALRPSTLDDLGLIPTLESYCKRFEKERGIRVQLSVKKKFRKRLPGAVETTAYRLIQESLNNIWKHSGAENTTVLLSISPTVLSITISDDGSGFDIPENISNRDSS